MASFWIPGENRFALEKPLTTVGGGEGYDLPFGDSGALSFTLQQEKEATWLIPGGAKVRLNGEAAKRPMQLSDCDRVEWCGRVAVFRKVDEQPAKAATSSDKEALALLRFAGQALDAETAASACEGFLAEALKLSNAEEAYLLSEASGRERWRLLASAPGTVAVRRSFQELVSSTVLEAAVIEKKPVYLERIEGHPWSSRESLIAAQVVSVACIPLVTGGWVTGALYLTTRNPGRPLQHEAFETLGAIGSLVARGATVSTRKGTDGSKPRVERIRSTALLYGQGDPSNPMRELIQRIEKLAPAELNLLLLGETGTGKELVAREIHNRSKRAAGPFIAVNCGALPPSLIESILFGHGKGAFTGADRAQVGKLQLAHGGTLFLDEIGDFPLELQVKVLRAIQERQIEPLGSTRPVPVDFRIVAATHRNLETLVAEGKFRADLMYRLNGATLSIAPLRDRGNDIVLLAEEFLRRADPSARFDDSARQGLRNYRWPGNVRELEQAVLRAAALAERSIVSAEDLELGKKLEAAAPEKVEAFGSLSSLRDAQELFTLEFVRRALERNGDSRSRTAAELEISERTLYRILAAAEEGSPV